MSDLIIKTVAYSEESNVIQAIRRSVFQAEQGVDATLDFDGQDETAEQIVAYLDDVPVGTARIRYLDSKTAKIERLALLPAARGRGIGKKIMEKALDAAAEKNIQDVVIHAQEYVKGLHLKLGFVEEGETFLEGEIPHIKMRKKLSIS